MTDGTGVRSERIYSASQMYNRAAANPDALVYLLNDLTERQRNDFWQRYMTIVEAGVQPTPEQAQRLLTLAAAGPGTDVLPYEDTREGPDQVVYYLRRGDQCKIGTTSSLITRRRAIRHDELLAKEPGGYVLEANRHREFAALRVKGEWFRYDGPLRDHVEALQQAKEAGAAAC